MKGRGGLHWGRTGRGEQSRSMRRWGLGEQWALSQGDGGDHKAKSAEAFHSQEVGLCTVAQGSHGRVWNRRVRRIYIDPCDYYEVWMGDGNPERKFRQ